MVVWFLDAFLAVFEPCMRTITSFPGPSLLLPPVSLPVLGSMFHSDIVLLVTFSACLGGGLLLELSVPQVDPTMFGRRLLKTGMLWGCCMLVHRFSAWKRNWERKSSRLLMSRTLLWKNISGSPSNKLDNWKRHTNQEVGGGGWRLTGHIGRRLGGGLLCSLGGAWSGLQRHQHQIGRPHSFISTSWTLISIYCIDGIINPSRRQLCQVLWVEIDGAYAASFSLPWSLCYIVPGLVISRCHGCRVSGMVAKVGNLRVCWRLVHGDDTYGILQISCQVYYQIAGILKWTY
ncbi:uncharacterized protein LOC120353136 [Nilaparvata lugens]|uniref:uncharacterized protein LOC120353136 n=1 Tax=Nilaparvata lugens TaxID=108931 RepID=UPI00193E3CD1|nr:uncharacterized protein LOC120353136 [Nilaparvata lugens]